MSAKSRYRYDPIDLERPSIRLIRLQHGSKEEPIRCGLFNAWLYEDVIEYEALSYTWGESEKPHDIYIENLTLPVTENLFQALKHLRYPFQDRIMWIDAIAIDQENLKERGHQVDQMGRVYFQAEQVMIWLGKPSLATDVFMDSLRSLHDKHNRIGGLRWEPSDPRWLDLWSTAQPELRAHHYNLETLQRKGLQTLLEHPWFRRVWILQEVANSKRATFQAGSKFIPTRIFILAPRLIKISVNSHNQAIFDIMPGPSRTTSWWSHKKDLYTLLDRFRESQATDERDMIYALLGMSSDRKNHGFQADYTKPAELVVYETCRYLFKERATLAGLTSIMPTFLENFALLNAERFAEMASNCTIEDATIFLGERGNNIVITESVIEAIFKNLQYGKTIVKVLWDMGRKNIYSMHYDDSRAKMDLPRNLGKQLR